MKECQGCLLSIAPSILRMRKKDPYRAPRIGEHSKEILEDIGISEEQQITLKERDYILGVIYE